MVFLVADDSRPTRNLIKNYIAEIKTSTPIYFLEAENGEIAFDIIQIEQVDFILCDWNMSTKMTGLDLLKQIRELEKTKNTPFIMVTSESDKSSIIEALKSGANDFVGKPIVQNVFKEKVLKIIASHAIL
jgi:two-component system chemotaxis response regulator CheY